MSFKPSQVELIVPPLVDTMHHAQTEFAAAMIVRALQRRGDTWRPITTAEVFEVAREDDKGEDPTWSKLYKNPFFRPDVHKLVANGYATWLEPTMETIEITDKGREVMQRWVRK